MSTVTRMMTVLAATALLSGCALSAGGEDREVSADAEEEAAVGVGPAEPGTLETCEELSTFDFEATQIRQAELIPESEEENAGEPVGEHCLVSGEMNERTSDADGERYAIGFEMRLPADWAGRFLHQANGGMDGEVVPAMGRFTGGQLEDGLQQGFAILSSDAGHSADQNPLFGMDPQARLDYGYQAVDALTPMAQALIEEAYGRGPDTSYFAGGSNGGRHAMVAASRSADEYDGFLAVAPGFNLPQAAVAQIWGAQQWDQVAEEPGDITTALSAEEREVVAAAILERCDDLDGVEDGIVADSEACQEAFDPQQDVPTCQEERDGTCLSAEQQEVLADVHAGAVDSAGDPIYTSFPFDPGITNEDWGWWTFEASVMLDPMAVGFVFSPEPADPAVLEDLPGYALEMDIDEAAAGISDEGIAGESAMEFMTPPAPYDLSELEAAGSKMMVVHGASDAVFSADDTARWYREVESQHEDARDFVRYFQVPGMAHVEDGVATDQFDGLGALVDWVEHGEAPEHMEATARGEGNPGGVNEELPDDWAADRTRLLCPYPEAAHYEEGDPEDAASFSCRQGSG